MEYIHRVFHVKSLIRYALALIVVLAALFARQVLVNALGGQLPPFITFYPAVMLIALLGGLGAGIFATIAATLCAIYYVIPPPNRFSIDFSTDIAGLSIFFCMGLAISIMSELYKRNREKISSCEKELEQTKVSDEIDIDADINYPPKYRIQRSHCR
jgi:K+-sensing histidine kinase KdpD